MSVFTNNLKKYIEHNSYKKKFVAKISGIEVNKFSRIINGKQEVTETDIINISKALGKDESYFLSKDFILKEQAFFEDKIAGFYITGSIDMRKNELANDLLKLVENFSSIVGVKKRIEARMNKEAIRELR